MTNVDVRSEAIRHWLKHTLKLEISVFEPASSDASFRRYFRVIHSKGQHIIMDAPPEKENIEPFIRIATLFKKSGIHVPKIYHQNTEQGFLMLEDFGSCCYLDRLDEENASELYQNALNSLLALQTEISSSHNPLPCYDSNLLEAELTLFYDWFLKRTLNLTIAENTRKHLNEILISSALEQPQVCVHRDFHSRNLMFLSGQPPGIIDFQDAVTGPITYDLVSLLRDCYIAWPEEKITAWSSDYYNQVKEANLTSANLKTFTQWFDLMGLQRHLKAIGIFSRLHLRDNKSNYLPDIPRTLAYVNQVCNKYPELAEFNQFLTLSIRPSYYQHTQVQI